MNNLYLDKDGLKTILSGITVSKAKDNNEIFSRVNQIEAEIITILERSLNNTWTLEHLLTLNAFWKFREGIIKKMNGYILKAGDIKNAINETNLNLEKDLKIIQEKKLLEEYAPVKCLELVRKHDLEVCDFITERIILGHYNLNFDQATNEKSRGITYDIEQAVNLFASKLNRNFKKQNVLELCLENNFGAYILSEKYGFFPNMPNCHYRYSADVDRSLDTGIVTRKFPYRYNGLIRLVKRVYDNANFFESKECLERIYNGGIIKIRKRYPDSFLCVQLSLSEYIFGFSNIMKIKTVIKDEISIDDLLFVEEELMEFINSYKTVKNIYERETTIKGISKPDKKLTSCQQDKKDCQEIAKKLWIDNPNLNIREIMDNEKIRSYKVKYTGKNTLRSWISKIDTRPPENKIGRPRKSK